MTGKMFGWYWSDYVWSFNLFSNLQLPGPQWGDLWVKSHRLHFCAGSRSSWTSWPSSATFQEYQMFSRGGEHLRRCSWELSRPVNMWLLFIMLHRAEHIGKLLAKQLVRPPVVHNLAPGDLSSRSFVLAWHSRWNVSSTHWVYLTETSGKEPIYNIWKGENHLKPHYLKGIWTNVLPAVFRMDQCQFFYLWWRQQRFESLPNQ